MGFYKKKEITPLLDEGRIWFLVPIHIAKTVALASAEREADLQNFETQGATTCVCKGQRYVVAN